MFSKVLGGLIDVVSCAEERTSSDVTLDKKGLVVSSTFTSHHMTSSSSLIIFNTRCSLFAPNSC